MISEIQIFWEDNKCFDMNLDKGDEIVDKCQYRLKIIGLSKINLPGYNIYLEQDSYLTPIFGLTTIMILIEERKNSFDNFFNWFDQLWTFQIQNVKPKDVSRSQNNQNCA